jgi:DNA-binding MarR family transcriptional regulator
MDLNLNTGQITERFIQLLPLVYNKMNRSFAKNTTVAKQSQLTHLQFHILEELFYIEEGVSLTQLAHNVSISKQQLTPLIAKLEELSYVLKAQDTRDRRSVKLMLTDKGKLAVEKRWEEFHHLFSSRIDQLSEDDLIDLDYAINKIIRILGKLD